MKRVPEEDLDMIVAQCVDEIWQVFDDDNSGQLDKEEAMKFIKVTLQGLQEDGGQLTNEELEACFQEFDEDQSGTIERNEMTSFIKKVAGL